MQIRQNGTVVFTGTGLPWTAANVKSIVYTIFRTQIVICFPGMQPQVISWTENTATFSIAPYEVQVIGNTKRTPFYRISPQGITMTVSDTGPVGATVTLVTSDPVFVAGMVGTYIQYIGRQILIAAVTDSMHATGTVQENLFSGLQLNFGNQPAGTDLSMSVSVGDVVIGQVSGAKGQVRKSHPRGGLGLSTFRC